MFSDAAPDEYVVITPLGRYFRSTRKQLPRLGGAGSAYILIHKGQLPAAQKADHNGAATCWHDHYRPAIHRPRDDTGYHHYAIDVAHHYELRNDPWRQSAWIKLYYAKDHRARGRRGNLWPSGAAGQAIKADLSIELAEAVLYADDGAAEVIKGF